MRRLAYSTRFGLTPLVGRLGIALLGIGLTMATAAGQETHRLSNSTVEVSIPSAKKRGSAERGSTGAAPRPRGTASVARTAAYEPVRKSYATRSRTAAVSSRIMDQDEEFPVVEPARMGAAGYAPYRGPSGPRAVQPYPTARMARVRQTGTLQGSASQPNGPAVEEVIPGPAMGGEVIYDDEYADAYGEGGAMPGGVFEGDYGGPGCAECCDGGPFYWGGGLPYFPHLWHHKNWGITAGAEALFVRPHFSQPVALEAINSTQASNGTLVQINGITWDNTYQGAFRGYLGLRNLMCGDELRFSYWNFGTSDNLSAIADKTTNYCDFLCNQTASPGDVIGTNMSLQVNVFDLDWIKPFCVPAPCDSCCGSDDSCGDCCEPCSPCCPIWDVRWFAGLRFAQINHNLNSWILTAESLNQTTAVAADASAKFSGVGPRLGMQVRKYFTNYPRLSVYGRGSGSLLVGTLDQQINNFNITDPATQTITTDSFNRLVPVAELEIGASWCILPRWTVTGGWAAWSFWDLGMQERVSDYDTSNILGFDGFFVRLETIF